MKKLFFVLYFFPIIALAQEKDSLFKYSNDELLHKAQNSNHLAQNKVLQYASELLKRNVSDTLTCYAYYELGGYYTHSEGNFAKSLSCFNKSLSYAKKTNDSYMSAITFSELAFLYAKESKYDKTLYYINEIKKNGKNYDFNLDLSDLYLLMGDFSSSKALSLKIINVPNEPYFTSFAYENLASCYNYTNELDSATFYIKKHKEHCKEKSINIQHDGLWDIEVQNFILRKQYDTAEERINNSKKYIDQSKTEIYLANYFYSLINQKKGNYKKSLEYCELALKNKVALASFANYELELYKIAAENAEKLNLAEKEIYYLKKYSQGAQKINYQEKAAFIAKLYDMDVIDPMKETIKAKNRKAVYLYSGLGFLALVLSFFIWKFTTSRKEKKKFLETIARLEQNEALLKVGSAEIVEKELESKIKNNDINEAAEKMILKKLSNFEKKYLFLKPEITAGSLASDFNTNVVYLSKVIKKHKNNNFNNYINQLKIDYVILELKTNPTYKNYKVTFWAEDCGIPYSTFVKVFNQQTGTTPSRFIEYLEEYKS